MNEISETRSLAKRLESLINEKKEKTSRILIVDEDENTRDLLTQYINTCKKNVSVVDSVKTKEEAIAMIDENDSYDVVIADNVKIFENLAELDKDLLSIVISEKKGADDARDALKEYGVSDYFTKPISVVVMNQIIVGIEQSLDDKVYEEFGREHGRPNLKKEIKNEMIYCLEGIRGRGKEKISERNAIERVFMKNVLIVSEDKDKREMIRELLKDKYNVITAENKEDAHQEGDLCSEADVALVYPGLAKNKEGYSGINLLYHIREDHSNVKRILLSGNKNLTTEDSIESLKQEGAIDAYSASLSKEDLVDTIEKTLKAKKYDLNFNNHLYLIMGTSTSGKSTLARNLGEMLTGRSRVCKKYTDRDLRPDEEANKEKADVMSFPQHITKFLGVTVKSGRKKEDILLSYKFEGNEYAIPKTILDDLNNGLDVFIVSTDYKQKEHILKVLKKRDMKEEKIIPIMIYSDISRINERLEKRKDNEKEKLKRMKKAQEQVAEFRENAHEFEYIVTNDLPIMEEDSMITAYSELALKKIIPFRNFRSSRDDDSKDYVSYLINCLFDGKYEKVEDLETAVNQESGIDIEFNEEKIREANIPYEIVENLPKTVRRVKKAHGRVTFVFDNYEDFERRNNLIKCIEAQSGEKARYTNEDANYKRFSLFGLLKAADRDTNQLVKEQAGVSEDGIHDAAVFSLTDSVGKLLSDESPFYALNIAFVKDFEKTRLDSISTEDYQAKKQELSAYDLNKGINDFNKP